MTLASRVATLVSKFNDRHGRDGRFASAQATATRAVHSLALHDPKSAPQGYTGQDVGNRIEDYRPVPIHNPTGTLAERLSPFSAKDTEHTNPEEFALQKYPNWHEAYTALDHFYEHPQSAPVVTVRLHDLVAAHDINHTGVQRYIDSNTVSSAGRGTGDLLMNRPSARPAGVLFEGKIHMVDGHHRTIASAFLGKTHLPMNVLDMDAILKKPGPTH